jgi:hypothetical protein
MEIRFSKKSFSTQQDAGGTERGRTLLGEKARRVGDQKTTTCITRDIKDTKTSWLERNWYTNEMKR